MAVERALLNVSAWQHQRRESTDVSIRGLTGSLANMLICPGSRIRIVFVYLCVISPSLGIYNA